MPKPRKYDPLTNHTASANEAAIAGALIPLDRVATELEAKWGIGVLPTLVDPELAMKFERARQKLDKAVEDGDPAKVAERARDMIRGWRALDAAAEDTPAEPYMAVCVEGDDGTAYAFVDHESHIPETKRRYPKHSVWSLREVARVLASHSLVNRAKEHWPQAEVVAVRKRTEMEDEIPF